jgi:surfeit locus 1 family protein
LNPDSPAARGRRRAASWLITVVALAVIVATLGLGRWQLQRAAQKEAIQAEMEAQKKLPPLDQQDFLALGDTAGAMHRPVRLRGLWLEPHTIYLDNRQMDGLQGFYVLTPFALEGTEQTVLVQRGFIQRSFTDRTQLQPVETPAGLVDIVGVLAPPPGRLLDMAKVDPAAPAAQTGVGSSPIRQNLDLTAYRDETKLPLRTDVTLQEDGPPSQGLKRDWPAPSLGVETNYGYAFQWFGLAALVAILYVWFQFIAPLRRRARDARRG